MTISTSASSVTYQGNGATTVFPFAFPVRQAGDLQVITTDNSVTPATVTTLPASLYGIAGLGNPAGGSVTYPLAGPPLAVGLALTVRRVMAYVQDTSIVNQGGFYPDVIEGALDTLTAQTQQLAEGLSRAVQIPVGSGLDPATYLPTIQACTTTSTAAAASAAASAATASAAATGAAASAANLPNGTSTGVGKVPQWNGAAWTGVNPGAGNMVNTGASTAGHVPKYTDTTGTALADGYAVGSTANALVQLDATGKLPAVDGSQLTGNIAVTRLALGTGASASTYWRGDGTWAAVSGITLHRQVFTSSGTFTFPAATTAATGFKVTCIGAGGAGGGAHSGSDTYNCSGGAAGAWLTKVLTGMTTGNTVTITIGAAGVGVPGADGGAGGATTVTSGTQTIATLTAGGGDGGKNSNISRNAFGGIASGGDLNFNGAANGITGTTYFNTNGVASPFGQGGTCTLVNNTAGNPGLGYGSGGGAAFGGSGSGTYAGGAGSPGCVLIEWVL